MHSCPARCRGIYEAVFEGEYHEPVSPPPSQPRPLFFSSLHFVFFHSFCSSVLFGRGLVIDSGDTQRHKHVPHAHNRRNHTEDGKEEERLEESAEKVERWLKDQQQAFVTATANINTSSTSPYASGHANAIAATASRSTTSRRRRTLQTHYTNTHSLPSGQAQQGLEFFLPSIHTAKICSRLSEKHSTR